MDQKAWNGRGFARASEPVPHFRLAPLGEDVDPVPSALTLVGTGAPRPAELEGRGPPASGSARKARRPAPKATYFLQVGDAHVPLYLGTTLVGRDPRNHIVLPYSGVSRRHASIVVTDECAQVADLGSRTGVLVNGVRVEEPRCLTPGDRLMIGGQALRFCAGDLTDEAGNEDTVASSREPPAQPPVVSGELTTQVFMRAFAANLTGPSLEAARIMLARIQEACASGARVPDGTLKTAAMMGARIVRRTLDGTWLDAVFRIYRVRAEVLPPEVIDALYTLPRHVELDARTLEDYVRALDARRTELTSSERLALSRTRAFLDVVRH